MDYTILVNKEHSLNKDYVPFDLVEINEPTGVKIDPSYVNRLSRVAYQAFKTMQKEAKLKGFDILIDSSYRSYEYQQKVLENCVKIDGIEYANTHVAKPGASEHQTGLAIDITVRRNNEILEFTADTDPEMKWLRHNSYKYGYILRYPECKESITGYSYEHWHYRYVGEYVAKIIYKNKITLEEYIDTFIG